MIQFCSASVRRGPNKVLDAIDCCFSPNRISVVLGENGAGKSSLFLTLLKQCQLAGGEVRVDGMNLKMLSAVEVPFKFVYGASISTPPLGMTINMVLTLGGYPFRVKKAVLRNAVHDALQLFELEHISEVHVNRVSAGQWQRVLLAKCWVQLALMPSYQVHYILLDEFETALDLKWRLRCLDIFKNKVSCCTGVILAGHDLATYRQLAECDCVLLRRGEVWAAGCDLLHDNETMAQFYGVKANSVPEGCFR